MLVVDDDADSAELLVLTLEHAGHEVRAAGVVEQVIPETIYRFVKVTLEKAEGEIRPDVMMGTPCLIGTRIPVYLILEKWGAGEAPDEILAAYPQRTKNHVSAALQYAAGLPGNEIILAS